MTCTFCGYEYTRGWHKTECCPRCQTNKSFPFWSDPCFVAWTIVQGHIQTLCWRCPSCGEVFTQTVSNYKKGQNPGHLCKPCRLVRIEDHSLLSRTSKHLTWKCCSCGKPFQQYLYSHKAGNNPHHICPACYNHLQGTRYRNPRLGSRLGRLVLKYKRENHFPKGLHCHHILPVGECVSYGYLSLCYDYHNFAIMTPEQHRLIHKGTPEEPFLLKLQSMILSSTNPESFALQVNLLHSNNFQSSLACWNEQFKL